MYGGVRSGTYVLLKKIIEGCWSGRPSAVVSFESAHVAVQRLTDSSDNATEPISGVGCAKAGPSEAAGAGASSEPFRPPPCAGSAGG